MRLADRPRLEVSPTTVGLTGLTSYFWLTDTPRTVSATATAAGFSVTAEASPVQYVWDFGDGAGTVTTTSGRAWRKTQPGNISHLYEKRGRYAIGVEVIWAARWRLNDGPWRPLGYFSNADSMSYPVRQLASVLTRAW